MHARATAEAISRSPVRASLLSAYRAQPFPLDVARETKTVELTDSLFEGRRKVKGITIDDPASPDLDDAMWAVRLPGKRYRLDVSISDVTSIVMQGSAIDLEAYSRVATIYRKKRPLSPMLPRRLSEDLLSLLEGQRRPTITVSMVINSKFEIGDIKITQTALASKKRTSPHEFGLAVEDKTHELHNQLRMQFRIAQGLHQRRREAGALAFWDLASGFATLEEGMIISLNSNRNTKGRFTVQEWMIATNRAVANYCIENGIPIPFRNHKLAGSESEIRKIFAQLEEASMSQNQLKRWLLRRKEIQMLGSAFYSPKPEGHWALGIRPGVDAYTHFTSPERRYADVLVHRQVHASLNDGKVATARRLKPQTDHINERSHEIKKINNEIDKEERYAKAQKAWEANKPYGLTNGDFLRFIKHGIKNKGMTPEIEDEIIERLYKNRLNEYVLFVMFFEEKVEPKAWERIRAEIYKYATERPNIAAALINAAIDAKLLQNKNYVLTQVNNNGRLGFEVSASIEANGINFHTDFQELGMQRRIRHSAALRLLEQLYMETNINGDLRSLVRN